MDNLSIVSGVNKNIDLLNRIPIDDTIFNKPKIHEVLRTSKWVSDRDDLLNVLSVNLFLSNYL